MVSPSFVYAFAAFFISAISVWQSWTEAAFPEEIVDLIHTSGGLADFAFTLLQRRRFP
jgi:hypothetical protein